MGYVTNVLQDAFGKINDLSWYQNESEIVDWVPKPRREIVTGSNYRDGKTLTVKIAAALLSIRIGRVGLIVGIAVTATAACLFINHCSQERAFRDDPNRFRQAIKDAAQIDNIVVNARDFPTQSELSTFVDPNGLQPLNVSGRAEIPDGISTCVVFVHGYNTCFTDCILNGNATLKAIRSSIGDDASRTLKFFTFCWRGDVGALRFDAANENARATAPAFGSFLQKLCIVRQSATKRRLFVVTHSLGALVALESLHGMQGNSHMPIVDTLVLVQPAVGIEKFGRGKIQQIITVPAHVSQRTGDPGWVDLPSFYNDGIYFDTITKTTAHTIATSSKADGVLQWAFYPWATGSTSRWITFPVNRIALGSVNDYLSKGWTFPANLKVEDLSPKRHLEASVHGHGDLFNPANRTLIPLLIHKVLEP